MVEPPSASRLSARWLRATAARLLAEAEDLVSLEDRIATFAIDGEIRFASAADRAAFVDELCGCLVALVGRYHDDSVAGRDHRVVVAVHPRVKEN